MKLTWARKAQNLYQLFFLIQINFGLEINEDIQNTFYYRATRDFRLFTAWSNHPASMA